MITMARSKAADAEAERRLSSVEEIRASATRRSSGVAAGEMPPWKSSRVGRGVLISRLPSVFALQSDVEKETPGVSQADGK